MNSPTSGRVGAPMASKKSKQLQRLIAAEIAQLQINQRKSAMQAPKPKSRKARKARRAARGATYEVPSSKMGFNLQGSSRMFESVEPVAVDASLCNPTYARVCGPVSHPDFGDGIRVEGRQLMTDVTTTGGDNQLFAGTGTATAFSINAIQLSPDALNGRLALQARNYSRYAFRKVRLHYVPRVATSDVGQLVIGYTTDGAVANFAASSFAALTSCAPSMVSPFRVAATMEVTYTGDLSWFTELDNASSAASRATVQGVFQGFPDLTSIGATQHGWIWIEYIVDLYGQNQDYGFTVTVKSEEEEREVRKALLKLRLEKEVDAEEWELGSAKGKLLSSRPGHDGGRRKNLD